MQDGNIKHEWKVVEEPFNFFKSCTQILRNNSLIVLVRGTDNNMWYTLFDGVFWRPWTTLHGIMTSGPAVTAFSNGSVSVFHRAWTATCGT